jgi:ubiquinone/menaquinone biosynthesis C-methylase UbiE
VRRVEAIDPEDRAGSGGGGTRGHQPDELGARHLYPMRGGFGLDPGDDLVQRRCLPVLDVHRDLGQACTPQLEAECTDAAEAAALLAHDGCDRPRDLDIPAEVDVERDQRPAGAEDHPAGSVVKTRRPEVGHELALVDPALQTLRTAAPVERGSALRRRIAEHGQTELATDPLGDDAGGAPRTLEIVGHQWHEWHDISRTDPRMRSFVRPQVDPLHRNGDAGEERVGKLALRADEREDRAVVVGVGVHVEQPRVRRQRIADRVDGRPVATFAEVGNRLEGQHGRTLGGVKEYYDTRAHEYDEWYLGTGRFSERDRPGWEAELDTLCQSIAGLDPVRTLDVACGTGFLTRHLRGDTVGLDQSTRMLEEAQRQAPRATFVQGDALELPFPNDSFARVFTGHFYGHLEPGARERFLAEARRVAPELVVADSSRRNSELDEEVSQRVLNDGSRWEVYKRYFTGAGLADELGGGEVLLDGRFFVVVRAAL